MIRLILFEELRFFIMNNMKMRYSTFSILFQCITHFSRDRLYITCDGQNKSESVYEDIIHLYITSISYTVYINAFYQDFLKKIIFYLF